MALLDGDKRSQLPSMSWNPIAPRRRSGGVKERGDAGDGKHSDDVDPSEVADSSEESETADNELDARADRDVAMGPPPAVFSAKALLEDSLSAASEPQSFVPAPAVGPSTDNADSAVPTDTSDQTDSSDTVVEPVIAETEPEAEPEPLPTIVEATPSYPPTSQIATVVDEEPKAAIPIVPIIPTIPDITPALAPAQTVSLPPSAAAMAAAAAHATAAHPARPPKQRKDRSGSVARVGFLLLLVGALASAAVIFGRPYLLPAEWDADAGAFAEPIQLARGTDFAEPVTLTAQPTDVHLSMVAAQLLGDPASQLPMWRALGLAGPDSTDDATLQALIVDRSPVLYSTVDGQLYYDDAFTRSDRAALILQAMATAALDQDFAFSADADGRTLDDAALTEAHVQQQATLIARKASAATPSSDFDGAPLAFLPVVLDYRLTAPLAFAELLPPVADVGVNPLAELGAAGPGPLRVPSLAQLPTGSPSAATAISTDTAGTTDTADGAASDPSAIVTDRSFWYMSFASHLDPAVAYRMSTQLQGAGLEMVERSTGSCAVATFMTADAATTAALQADLGAWVAAAAPELGASVTASPTGQVEFRSCDPAGAYTSNIRFGAARQLIAWRSIELAVTDLLLSEGGTEADVAAAIALIGTTPSADAVVRLPAGTPPAELAAAAKAAAADVVAASAVAPVADGES